MNELKVRDLLDKEREKSDRAYAAKLIEKIVFSFLGLLATGVIIGLLDLLFQHLKFH